MTFIRQEARALAALTAPILITQIAQMGMGTIDTLMAGYVSTRDLAAVAIGTSIWLPAWLFLSGVLVALSPLASRLHSSDQQQRMPHLQAAAVSLGLIMGVLTALVLAIAAWLLPSFSNDQQTAAIASDYLLAVALGMPAAGLFLALRFYSEAVGHAHRVTLVMLGGLALNIPANALFVYGLLGLPELGGVGCGIGTTLVFVLMALALLADTRKRRLPTHWPLLRESLQPDWEQIRQLLKIGLPIGAAIFFEVSLFTVIALFLAGLGPTTVAGHQVALNLSSITFMIPLSMGMSITVRVGHHLGRNNIEAARRTAWLGIRLNLLIAAFNATLMVTLSETIAGLYSPDPAVVSLAATLLLYAAVFQLSDATQVAAAGALRGYHDTLMVMLITFGAYWVAGLGCGYWLGFYGSEYLGIAPMGAEGFWIGLITGLTMAALGLLTRLWRVSNRYVH
ncbi:MATE family efflux transporter [Parathalassolituus penaei]|uniref:Multidrug-efflux transporter n=1 Tax=Parathalassolituus penaei TaxID=2997323 RepID=A0A9X3EG40_9GAMM|nr:MATE family efflux transporter [Parathalassolituus penaei]MCY0966611.1 MATE family efflux transporter [Parathalassolituus penaei]